MKSAIIIQENLCKEVKKYLTINKVNNQQAKEIIIDKFGESYFRHLAKRLKYRQLHHRKFISLQPQSLVQNVENQLKQNLEENTFCMKYQSQDVNKQKNIDATERFGRLGKVSMRDIMKQIRKKKTASHEGSKILQNLQICKRVHTTEQNNIRVGYLHRQQDKEQKILQLLHEKEFSLIDHLNRRNACEFVKNKNKQKQYQRVSDDNQSSKTKYCKRQETIPSSSTELLKMENQKLMTISEQKSKKFMPMGKFNKSQKKTIAFKIERDQSFVHCLNSKKIQRINTNHQRKGDFNGSISAWKKINSIQQASQLKLDKKNPLRNGFIIQELHNSNKNLSYDGNVKLPYGLSYLNQRNRTRKIQTILSISHKKSNIENSKCKRTEKCLTQQESEESLFQTFVIQQT